MSNLLRSLKSEKIWVRQGKGQIFRECPWTWCGSCPWRLLIKNFSQYHSQVNSWGKEGILTCQCTWLFPFPLLASSLNFIWLLWVVITPWVTTLLRENDSKQLAEIQGTGHSGQLDGLICTWQFKLLQH